VCDVASRLCTAPAAAPSAVCLRNPLLHGLLLIYRPRKDERLSWPCWLTYSGQFTHKVPVVTYLTISQAQRRTGKVRRSKTSVLPLCYVANSFSSHLIPKASYPSMLIQNRKSCLCASAGLSASKQNIDHLVIYIWMLELITMVIFTQISLNYNRSVEWNWYESLTKM